MPTVGTGSDMVSFPYDEQGIKAAEKYAQAMGLTVDYSTQASQQPGQMSNISLGYEQSYEKGGKVPSSKVPSSDARERSGKYEMGGKAKKYKK